MREDAVHIVQVEEVDESNGRMPPPIWVVVVVVAVVTGGWLLATQGSTDTDPVTNPTSLPATPDEASVVTPTVASPTAADAVSVFGNPPASIRAETPQQLRGYVAVTSPGDPLFTQDTVWVFRPGGSLVSRADAPIPRFAAKYPMLITAGHLIVGNQIFDIDLAEPPISLWTDASVYPGSGPGVVWLARRQSRSRLSAADWVSPVDVESLTVGEQVDLTGVLFLPLVGVADGLIVADVQEDIVFWSPTDGLADVVLTLDLDAVVAASGNIVVLVTSGSVNLLDIVSGEQVVSLLVDFAVPVTSACLSPDRQHVIVVAFNGDAAVGNTATGEVISLNDDGVSVQPKHGIGWTTDDQLVFIGDVEGDAKHIFGFDISSGDGFVIAELDGPEEWWMTASGTMC